MFLSHIHTFRALAIVLIVASHCPVMFDWNGRQGLLDAVHVVVENSTVYFVFISGFLFQHLAFKYRFGRYVERKFWNVISPYLIVSVPMIALQYLTHRGSFSPDSGLEFPSIYHNVAWLYLTGYHVLPFYFIPMMAVYYLAAPLLFRLDRDRRIYWLLPAIVLVAPLVHRPVDFSHILHSALCFFPAYLFGMWFSRHRERIELLVERYLWGFVAVAAVLLGAELLTLEHPGTIRSRLPFSMENGVYDFNYLRKVVLCFVLVHLLKRYDEAIRKRVSYLATVSFGVFFLHIYFIELFAELIFRDGLPTANLPLFVLLLAVVVGLCVASLWVAKKVLGRYSRMVVGS